MFNYSMITLVSDQTLPNVLAIKHFLPRKLYLLHTSDKRYEQIVANIKKYVSKKYHNHISVVCRLIEAHNHESTYRACREIIETCQSKNEGALVNATGGTKLMAFGALQAGFEKRCPVIYVNTQEGSFININHTHHMDFPMQMPLPALEVQDFIDAFGATLRSDMTNYARMEKQRLYSLALYLMRHLNEWKETSMYLSQGKHSYQTVNGKFNMPYTIKDKTGKRFRCHYNIMQKLHDAKIIRDLKIQNKRVIFSRDTDPESEWLLQSGTPLELLVFYRLMSHCDDIKLGVKFVWNNDMELSAVENEIDVLFSANAKLYCVSCKSGKLSGKTGTETLNELETYATKLGGPFAGKIIVTNQHNIDNQALMNRAKNMHIRLVAYEQILHDSNTAIQKIVS